MWISSKAYFKSFVIELQSCFSSLYGKFSSLKVESHLDLLKEEGLTLGNWPNDNFRLITKLFQNSTQPCFWPEIPSDQMNWTSQRATKNCPRRPPRPAGLWEGHTGRMYPRSRQCHDEPFFYTFAFGFRSKAGGGLAGILLSEPHPGERRLES